MKKIKYPVLALLFLFASAASFGQQNDIAAKMDSAKRTFFKQDSLRRSYEEHDRDTVKNILRQSHYFTIYGGEAKAGEAGVQQVDLQLVRFRHQHFINVVVRAGLSRQVTISPNSKLSFGTTDNASLTLNSGGLATAQGIAGHSCAELRMIYSLSESDFRTLTNKRVNWISIAYDGGSWDLPVNMAAIGKVF